MALLHSITVEDVRRLYAAQLARHKSPKDALMGTRTEVHEALQVQCPMPYPLDPPTREFNVKGEVYGPDNVLYHDPALAKSERAARDADIRARKAAVRARVTDAEILASERARTGKPGVDHLDALHYVQKQHGALLWQEVDRLVLVAGVGGGR